MPPLTACLPLAISQVQVCTSELGAAAKLQGEFAKRGVQLVALSCNDLESHKQCELAGQWGWSRGGRLEAHAV